MFLRWHPFFSRLRRREDGSAAVEFAFCLIPLLLIIGGIIDYGEVYYMQTMITNASREGARYAARYQTDAAGIHKLPNALNPSVSSWVTSQYASLLPSNALLTVTPGGAGYTSGTALADITVTVTARKYWFFLSNLVPGLTNPMVLTATAVMKCE